MTSQDEKRLLTHSAMACARRCLRQYFYHYELGLRSRREATALRLGAAVHVGLELWSKGATPEAAILAAIEGYAACPAWAEPYDWQIERETVANLLAGYFWRYGNDALDYVEIEKPWGMPLVNPNSGRESRTYRLAGKRDGLVRVSDSRLFVLERKTTGEDISPESEYWLRLRCDQQISLYVLSALHQGHDVAGVLYDVIRKPTIRPRQIPLLDEAGLKIVADEATGERLFNKDGKPRQSAGTGMKLATRSESPEEYGTRLLADVEERPDYYFQRREVPRLEDDLQAFRLECWQQAQLLSDCRRWGRWFRNVGQNTCSFCEYANLCLQSTTVNPEAPPDGFEIVSDVHPELSEEKNEMPAVTPHTVSRRNPPPRPAAPERNKVCSDAPEPVPDSGAPAAEPTPAAPSEPVTWCPVCGNAAALDEKGGFCSRACRVASLDYHNAQSLEADEEYERRGSLAYDKAYDCKGTR